jgi:hypothetical protein
MQWLPIYSSKFDSLPITGRFDAMADAYLDSSQRLCRTLARSTKSATYERGMVVMYLVHHSVELFLKGLVLRKAPNETFNHDLEQLGNRYHSLYPGERFAISVPFSVSVRGVKNDEKSLAQKFIRTRTERLRYPIDKSGQPWGGASAFEARSFLQTLECLESSYARIRLAVDA